MPLWDGLARAFPAKAAKVAESGNGFDARCAEGVIVRSLRG